VSAVRTFVVPDAHGKLGLVHRLLREQGILGDNASRVDRETTVVQLGDLCNCVPESVDDDLRCLDRAPEWFDVYLVGNHEHPYLGGPRFSGFYSDPEIAHRLKLLYSKGLLQAAYAADGILVTHAGVGAAWQRSLDRRTAAGAASRLNKLWRARPTAELFGCIGRSRGGSSPTGGILWADWSEPKSDAFSQIVGHTVGDQPRWQKHAEGKFAVCIDLGGTTAIVGAWITDGKVELVRAGE